MKSQTNLSYKGEVTLKYKVGNKVIKVKKFNKGWSQLFRLIALILTGNMTVNQLKLLRPTYVDLKYKDNGVWKSCIYSSVPVTPSFTTEIDNNIDGGVSYISVFTVAISYSNLNQSIIDTFDTETENKTETAMFLLSGEDPLSAEDDSNTRLASLNVDCASIAEMLPGSQVIVEWTMKFYNA